MTAARLTAMAVLLGGASAFACSRFEPVIEASFPNNGATGVPLNAEWKVVSEAALEWTLTDASGAALEAVVSRRGRVTLVRAAAPLAPLTTYTITATVDERYGGGTTSLSFTTGMVSDTTPPRLEGRPSVYPAKKDPFATPSSCSGYYELYTVVFPLASDDVTPMTQLLVEGGFATDEAALAETTNFLGRCTVAPEGGCALAVVMSDRQPRFFQARLVDVAGNASPASEPELLRGCGCGSAEGAAGLLALALLYRRRRPAKDRPPAAKVAVQGP